MGDGVAWWLASGAAVEKQVALRVAAKEVTLLNHANGARPAMGMDRHKVTGWDTNLQDTDAFVFEDELVMVRGGDEGVQ